MGKYQSTIYACMVGYIVQAIVNNFLPLLFLTFNESFGIPLSKITLLITINFFVQLSVDVLAAFFVDKIGYRKSVIIAHIAAAAGLISLGILPYIMENAFVGLLISTILYAIGGGIIEVVISPIVEACPNDHKERTMSILHSFYCWGSVGTILIASIFFLAFGIENWRILAFLWAVIPIVNGLAFTKVPLVSLVKEGEKALSVKQLFKNRAFIIFIIVIFCGGASEITISQWSSAFVEKSLGISKAFSDLVGPAFFAVMMGLTRGLYGKFGERFNLERLMLLSGILCVFTYLLMGLVNTPAVSLIAMAVSGVSVAILWPGTYSAASNAIKGGGNAMFAFLALAGDLGCSAGPSLAGFVSGAFDDNLKIGILAATVFPLILILALYFRKKI